MFGKPSFNRFMGGFGFIFTFFLLDYHFFSKKRSPPTTTKIEINDQSPPPEAQTGSRRGPAGTKSARRRRTGPTSRASERE